MFCRQISFRLQRITFVMSKHFCSSGTAGIPGSGAGSGGGGGGPIREAGGTFGKVEAVREEEYFRKLQKQQVEQLKSHLAEEVQYHEEEIKRHEEAISKHKERAKKLDKD